MTRLACFISPHGFGHAARCCAAMESVARLRSGLELEIFTTVPDWFLRESLTVPFRRHDVVTDIGLRQRSALEEDLEGTIEALGGFIPFDRDLVDGLAATVARLDCRAVVCDISPLGIEVAQRAGRPSVLIENFTWDWIYAGYQAAAPGLDRFVAAMRETFERRDVHIQTQPVCRPDPGAHLTTGPVSRLPRATRTGTRRRLGIDEGALVVLVTMGGVPQELDFGAELLRRRGIHFLVTGASRTAVEDNVHWFDNRTALYLPDLVRAADVVVAKLGYSTVAEVWREARPMVYVTRGRFPESPVLERFVRSNVGGFGISESEFQSGRWLAGVEGLSRRQPVDSPRSGGNEELAAFLVDLLD